MQRTVSLRSRRYLRIGSPIALSVSPVGSSSCSALIVRMYLRPRLRHGPGPGPGPGTAPARHGTAPARPRHGTAPARHGPGTAPARHGPGTARPRHGTAPARRSADRNRSHVDVARCGCQNVQWFAAAAAAPVRAMSAAQGMRPERCSATRRHARAPRRHTTGMAMPLRPHADMHPRSAGIPAALPRAGMSRRGRGQPARAGLVPQGRALAVSGH
jgi:hypothetical protein